MQSDHYLVEVNLRTKLAAVGPRIQSCYAPRFIKPSERQWKLFNGFIRDHYCSAHDHPHWKGFTDSLKQAAETCLSKESKSCKKNYLSTQTWSLIRRRSQSFGQANQKAGASRPEKTYHKPVSPRSRRP